MIGIVVNIVLIGTAVIFGGVAWFLYAFSKAYHARKQPELLACFPNKDIFALWKAKSYFLSLLVPSV